MTKMQNENSITTAIAWCLAWGEKRQPQFELSVLQEMRQALKDSQQVPEEVRSLVEQVQQLQGIDRHYFPKILKELQEKYPDLWNQRTPIGLVYGGATKIKSYVFEAAKLPDIRGASALLDRINLVDLPAFFGQIPASATEQTKKYCQGVRKWLDKNSPISEALIPELIIYSTGGNLLAFCPAAFVDDLASSIEKRYSEETLTANSCAVGNTYRLLEIRFRLLEDKIEETRWLDWYRQANSHRNEEVKKIVQIYYGNPQNETELVEAFTNRKSFNELAGQLAAQFNQRRNGNNSQERPSRCYPPMLETHPYLRRDESDRASA